jgi:hypothetical protein
MKYFLTVSWFCISLQLVGQTTFDIYFNAQAGCSFNSIAKTNDGGFILCGVGTNSSDGTSDFFFQKFDSLGQQQWSKQLTDTFVSGFDEVATKVVQNFNGNYFFTGTIQYQNDIYTMVAVYGEFDSTGNYVSFDELPYGLYSSSDNIILCPDSNLLVLYSNYDGAGNYNEPVVKLTTQNSVVWYSSAGAYNLSRGHNLAASPNSFYVSLGVAYDYYYSTDYFHQPVASRISSTGNIDWTFPFLREETSNELPSLQSICPTYDNGAMICGYWDPNGNNEVSIVHISPQGDSVWTKGYGNASHSYWGNDIQLCQDSGFIITGSATNDCLADNRDVFLLKLDSSADSVWSRTFGGLNFNSSTQVIQTDDKGFLIFGSSSNSQLSFYRVIKVDSLGANSGNAFTITANNMCGVFCAGDTALLTVNPSGTGYIWSDGETTQTISVTTSGGFNVTVTDSSGNQNYTDFFSVNFLSPPISDIGADSIMVCGEYVISSLATSSLANQYQWYLDNIPISNAVGSSLTLDSSGNYSLIISNQCGADTAYTFVQINPLPPSPNITDTGNGDFCSGDSIKLFTTSYGYQYQWYQTWWNSYPIAGAYDSVYYAVETGVFSVEIIDSFNCKARSSDVWIYERPLPAVSLGFDTSICSGSTLILNPGNFSSYLWQDNSNDSSFTVTTSGVYSLTATNSFGCAASDTIEVIINQLPSIFLGNDTTLCISQTITLDAGNIFLDYLWQDSSSSSILLVSSVNVDTSNYSVLVTDINGCSNSDTIQVIFDICAGINQSLQNGIIIYPNPFNQVLSVTITQLTEGKLIAKIFDVTGNLLFTKNLISKNEALDFTKYPSGIYFLLLQNLETTFVRKLTKL